MQSRLLMKEARISARKAGEYFEAHHIVPVSMGGDGTARQLKHSNIVLLTGREHYIAHALLFIIYRTRSLSFAFKAMCISKNGKKRNYTVSSRLYDELKKEIRKIGFSAETRKKLSKKSKGRIVSKETRDKLRQVNLGKKHSDVTKEKLRQVNLGKKQSKETCEKRRLKLLGRVVSEETCEKLRQINLGNKNALGRVVSEETRRKIGINSGNARRGMKQTPEHIENVKIAKKIAKLKRQEQKMNMTK